MMTNRGEFHFSSDLRNRGPALESLAGITSDLIKGNNKNILSCMH